MLKVFVQSRLLLQTSYFVVASVVMAAKIILLRFPLPFQTTRGEKMKALCVKINNCSSIEFRGCTARKMRSVETPVESPCI